MVPTNLVHIVVAPGRDTWDRKTIDINKKIKEIANIKFRTILFLKNTKTNMIAVARPIDLKGGWTDFHFNLNKNQKIVCSHELAPAQIGKDDNASIVFSSRQDKTH